MTCVDEFKRVLETKCFTREYIFHSDRNPINMRMTVNEISIEMFHLSMCVCSFILMRSSLVNDFAHLTRIIILSRTLKSSVTTICHLLYNIESVRMYLCVYFIALRCDQYVRMTFDK